jgi:(S)-ureidoglycine aminohydrolase
VYYAQTGGHPGQDQLLTDRAMFTEAYAVLPRGTMRDIVVSYLPHWELTRLWVLARPLSGFAETFSQYLVEVLPGGGSDRPESDPAAEAVLFVVDGDLDLTVDGELHRLGAGGYAYLPAGQAWTAATTPDRSLLRFHWIRKAYEPGRRPRRAGGLRHLRAGGDPDPDARHRTGRWLTTRFVEPSDLRHDMHVNVVTFLPGAVIPFARPTSWSTGSTSSRARRSTGSTRTGSRSRPATSCGCAPSARRPATPAVPGRSATCSTRTSTATSAGAPAPVGARARPLRQDGCPPRAEGHP